MSLQSAYKQVDGKEPDFTNNAKVRNGPYVHTITVSYHAMP